jgi:hypothetical protein
MAPVCDQRMRKNGDQFADSSQFDHLFLYLFDLEGSYQLFLEFGEITCNIELEN